MSAQLENASGIVVLKRDRNFYVAMALACAVTVFVGFAPTYYLRSDTVAPLAPLLHVHGAIFTGWIALFILQTVLVRTGRRDWHRRFGVLGMLLASAMVWIGIEVAIQGAAAGTAGARQGVPPLLFLTIPLGGVVVFIALVGLAIYFRHKSDTHKRLMLLATISILTPAIGRMRLEFFGMQGPLVNFAVTDLFIVACALYDVAKHHRVHAAYIWGGLAVIVSQPLRLAIGHTDVWKTFAMWLTT